MIDIKNKKDCCGCTACESICTHNAISMVVDRVGFVYPQVNETKCISCGLCSKVCPIINDVALREPINSFVAVSTDNEEQLSSTSGGLASTFARYIISEKQGIVYGCTGENCHHVRHIRIDKTADLYKLKGSKYVQSDISGIYNYVKKDLSDGKIVLFIGTPCQNAGLKSYLRRDYDNLYCVDFVCHGVPSQKMLSDHINTLKLKDKANTASFRYKEKGKKSRYLLTITNKYKSLLYRKGYRVDLYMSGFLLGLFYRDSCYSCKFATSKRVSDLTIGDYWDKAKEYNALINSNDGLSQMHINSEKGQKLINELSTKIASEPIELEKLLKHSLQLQEPMKRHEKHGLFMQLYPNEGFKKACKIAMASNYKAFRKQRVLDIIFLIPGVRRIYTKIKGK